MSDISNNNIIDIDDSTILENTPVIKITKGGKSLYIPIMTYYDEAPSGSEDSSSSVPGEESSSSLPGDESSSSSESVTVVPSEYYLCTSVDGDTWTGIRISKSGDSYTTDGDPVSGLTVTTHTPKVNEIYTADTGIKADMQLDDSIYRMYVTGPVYVNGTKQNQYEYTGIPNRLDFTYIAAHDHIIALDKDGIMWGMGDNSSGQLGLGDTKPRYDFVQISDKKWKLVAVSEGYTMAVDTDGRLWVCGSNKYGRLGLGPSDSALIRTSFQDTSVVNVISIDTSEDHCAVIDGDGKYWACGSNAYGECFPGTGVTQYSTWSSVAEPTIEGALPAKWLNVKCGYFFTILMDAEGKLYACGNNADGKLGIGSTTTPSAIHEVGYTDEEKNLRYKVISVVYKHTLAIDYDDNLYSWGNGDYGKLGSGTPTRDTQPTQVADIKCSDVSAGRDHSVIIDKDGNLLACGDSTYGQLGLYTNKPIYNFVKVGSSKWRGLGSGKYNTSVALRA